MRGGQRQAAGEEDRRLLARAADWMDRAERTYSVCCSPFLDEHQRRLLECECSGAGEVAVLFYGGYEGAQRTVAAFYRQDCGVPEPSDFPVTAVEIRVKREENRLTHRDYLGTLMSLDIRRDRIGDILVYPDRAVVFADEKLAEFLCGQVTKVRNQGVIVRLADGPVVPPPQRVKEVRGSVASLRLDCVLSLAWKLPRSEAQKLVESGRVSLNFMPEEGPARQVAEGDVLSVQGYGRALLQEIGGTTKKGRYSILINLFI